MKRRSPFANLVRESVGKPSVERTTPTRQSCTHSPARTDARSDIHIPHWHAPCGVSALGAEETAAPVRHTATPFRLQDPSARPYVWMGPKLHGAFREKSRPAYSPSFLFHFTTVFEISCQDSQINNNKKLQQKTKLVL